MLDTLAVTYKTGTTFDDVTGEETPIFATKFTSKCKVATGGLGDLIPTVKDDPAAGRVVTETRLIMFMPVDAGEVLPDDVLVITAIGPETDPHLLGSRLRAVARISQSWATARRFSVEELVA